MRMFLVGMCDIFLLLYLTAIAQDSRGVSDLTVDDYVELRTSSEALKKKSQEIADRVKGEAERAAEAEKRARELEARLKAIEEERKRADERAAALERERKSAAEKVTGLETQNAELKEADARAEALAAQLRDLARARAHLESENAKLQEADSRARDLAAELRAARLQTEEEQRAAAERLGQETKAREAAIARVAQVESHAAQTAAELEEARTRAEAEKRAAEEARKAAEEAQAEAEKARQEALAARSAEEEATKRAGEALTRANEARRAEQDALSQAISAQVVAAESKADAEAASQQAQESEAQARNVTETLRTVTQSTDAAFEDKVKHGIVALKVEVESKGLLGRSTDQFEFSAVPVRRGDTRVVFLPREHAELSESTSSLNVRLGNERAQSVLINNTEPSLVGFVFKGKGAAAELLPREGPPDRIYMPTLIAVRNGSPLGFTDRLRRVGRHYFPFERDRLTRDGRTALRFKADGFRGTGDFAQYLVPGDQVVDLNGNLAGIVTADNRIHQLSFSDWREMPLSYLEPAGRPG